VDRQYSGTLGKTGNCQIAVSVHHVEERGNAPLGRRLYLPESWANHAGRRREAGIPEEIVFGKKRELGPEILDRIRGWGLADGVVLADGGAVRCGDRRPVTVKEAAARAKGWKKIRWREGSKGWLESRFRAARVQSSHRYRDGRPPGKEVRLPAEWPESESAPTQSWL
jgi:SRSO17 transposase